MANLTLLIGIPFSGKSTLAKELAKMEKTHVIVYDQVKHHYKDHSNKTKIINHIVTESLKFSKRGFDIIIDHNNYLEDERKLFIEHLKAHFDKIKAIFVNEDIDIIVDRIKNSGDNPPSGPVYKIFKRLEIPRYTEGFDTIECTGTINPSTQLAFEPFKELISKGLIGQAEYKWMEFTKKHFCDFYKTYGFIQQEDPNKLPVGQHLLKTHGFLKKYNVDDFVLGMATLCHDIGKTGRSVKTRAGHLAEDYKYLKRNHPVQITEEKNDTFEVFINGYDTLSLPRFVKKGKTKYPLLNLSHRYQYIGHDSVSAQMFLRFAVKAGISTNVALNIAYLIEKHMETKIDDDVFDMLKNLNPLYFERLLLLSIFDEIAN